MTQNATDRARDRWGISKETPVVIDGAGDGGLFEDARQTVRGLMPQLVGLDGVVLKTKLAELHKLLTDFGLQKTDDQGYNPPGRQLFYKKGRLLVRIKTKGNPPSARYRANQPHLSVGLMRDSVDTSFDAEMVKFSPIGRARPKSTRPGTFLLPVTGTSERPSYSGDPDEWGRMTHFSFPPDIAEVT
jgi:hypothetical protein